MKLVYLPAFYHRNQPFIQVNIPFVHRIRCPTNLWWYLQPPKRWHGCSQIPEFSSGMLQFTQSFRFLGLKRELKICWKWCLLYHQNCLNDICWIMFTCIIFQWGNVAKKSRFSGFLFPPTWMILVICHENSSNQIERVWVHIRLMENGPQKKGTYIPTASLQTNQLKTGTVTVNGTYVNVKNINQWDDGIRPRAVC